MRSGTYCPRPLGERVLATGACISRGESGEGVKTVGPGANLTLGNPFGVNLLTPRLAVPPRPQLTMSHIFG
jgi:hypothetical protein